MFIPDYLGNDAWQLPMINRDHFKIKPILESDEQVGYFPWIELDIKYSYETWLKEIKLVDDSFVEFESEYGKGWKYVSMYEDDKWNDRLLNGCPATTTWFKNIFSEKINATKIHNIKVMCLEPKGYSELQHGNHFGQINFVLNQPIGCKTVMFYPNSMDKTKLKDSDYIGIVPFREGSAIQLNNENYNMARNNGEENRYHIIVNADTEINDTVKMLYDESIKHTTTNIKKDAQL
tara:strand:- start:258 stop:959 length:702 start_codon:yes stop_codon:yes gene_type:complete